MIKHFVLAVAALLLATAAWAADQETGKVISVDAAANTFTIQTDGGDRIVYRTEGSTRMLRDGAAVQIGDLAVGTRVEVTAPEAEGMAPRTASQVDLVAAADVPGAGARMGGEAAVGAEAGRAGVRANADVDVDAGGGAPPREETRTAQANRLPSTASPLPLLGLLGASGVTAGLFLRRLRR